MPGPTRSDIDAALASFDWQAWATRFTNLYSPWYHTTVSQAGEDASDEHDGEWRSNDPGVRAFGVQYVAQRIVQIDDTTRDRVQTIVEAYFASLDAGESASLVDLGATISDAFEDMSRSRAATIARTETGYAVNHGAAFNYRQNGFDYVEIADGDSDEECAEADGQIWSIDYFLANALEHPNCLPGDMLVTAPKQLLATFTRWFEGELTILRTASNQLLACTANHPVLTLRGWVAAHLLRQGDYVLSSRSREGIARRLDPHHDQMPAPMEQVARAPRMSGGVSAHAMPCAAEYFHGDGASSDVYVERTRRTLKDRRHAGLFEPGRHLSIGDAHRRLSAFARLCALLQLARRPSHAANGIVGRRHSGASLADRHARVHQVTSLAVAPSDGGSPSVLANRRARDAQSFRHLGRRVPGSIQPYDIGHGQMALVRIAKHVARVMKPAGDRLRISPDGSRDLIDRLTGLVLPVQITDIATRAFRGHLYNLATPDGWYVASGIVTHNCERSASPISNADVDDAGGPDEE